MSRDYFDDGYDFTTNRITLPSGEAVLITPSRNKHRLYIADLPDRIKRRCLTLPTDDHFLDNGCDQHKLCEMDDDERIALVTEQARVAYPILPTIGLGVRTNPLAEAQPQMLTVRFRAALCHKARIRRHKPRGEPARRSLDGGRKARRAAPWKIPFGL